MIKRIITILLILISSLVFATNGLKIENIEVKVNRIDYKEHTVEYVYENKVNVVKLSPDVIEDGYFDDKGNSIDLNKLSLNKKYFLRIVQNDYINEKNKKISEKYVSTISILPYDEFF